LKEKNNRVTKRGNKAPQSPGASERKEKNPEKKIPIGIQGKGNRDSLDPGQQT